MDDQEHDQLVTKFAALLKNKDRQQRVDIESSDTKAIKDWKSCLVAKVYTDKKVGFVGLKESLTKAWDQCGRVRLSEYYHGAILIRFPDTNSLEKNLDSIAMVV